LLKAGVANFDKKVCDVSHHAFSTLTPIHGPHDEFEYKFASTAKGIAINIGTLIPMPLESILMINGKLPGVLEATSVPDEVLVNFQNASESCMSLLGERSLTIAEMKRLMSTHSKPLLALDPTFIVDLIFLQEIVADIPKKRIEDRVVGCFSSADESRSQLMSSTSSGTQDL